MKSAKRFEFLLYFLWVSITLWIARLRISSVLDSITNPLFHRAFSQRSGKTQFLVILVLAFLVSYLIWRLVRRIHNTKWIQILCILSSAWLIGILCWSQTLRRDDYWEIRDAYKYGFPGFVTYEYRNVCGRYFSQFLKSLYQFFPPTEYINTLLIITFLLLWIGCLLLLRTCLRKSEQIELLSGGLAMALAVMFMSPNIWEVWFWGGGTFIYGVGIALTIMAAALMIWNDISDDHSTARTFAAALCIACACGTSELNTASVCSFSFLIFILPKILYGQKLNRKNGFLVLFAWGGTAFILLTSGDLKSNAYLPEGESNFSLISMLQVFPEKILESVQNILQYFSGRIEFVLLFLSLAFSFGVCSGKKHIPAKLSCAVVLSAILTGVGALTINSMLDFMPPRVVSIPLGWIILAMMLAACDAGIRFRNRFFQSFPFRTVSVLIPLVMLTVVGWFYLNHIDLVRNIRSAWIDRDETLRSMAGTDVPVETCAIPVLGSSAADPSDDPTRDFNIVTAYYYGLPSVAADHLCHPFDDLQQ